jgi:hypothetical protein
MASSAVPPGREVPIANSLLKQAQAATKDKSKDEVGKESEEEFKSKHLGLLGVFVWIL